MTDRSKNLQLSKERDPERSRTEARGGGALGAAVKRGGRGRGGGRNACLVPFRSLCVVRPQWEAVSGGGHCLTEVL